MFHRTCSIYHVGVKDTFHLPQAFRLKIAISLIEVTHDAECECGSYRTPLNAFFRLFRHDENAYRCGQAVRPTDPHMEKRPQEPMVEQSKLT